MPIFYVLRVVVISFEGLLIAAAWLLSSFAADELRVAASSLELNEEMLKWLMVLPIGLAVWVFNEVRSLLQEDNETVRILTAWPDYWKLKVHVWVGLFYACAFVCMSLAPWLSRSGISTGAGLLLFGTSILGQLAAAFSVYAARIRMKEIIVHLMPT